MTNVEIFRASAARRMTPERAATLMLYGGKLTMTDQRKATLRSTLSAIIAALVMFGPDILEAFSVTDASPKWVKLAAKATGLIIGLATSGKAVAILNKFLPATQAQTIQVIQQPEPPIDRKPAA